MYNDKLLRSNKNANQETTIIPKTAPHNISTSDRRNYDLDWLKVRGSFV